jgi:hypothetical protein
MALPDYNRQFMEKVRRSEPIFNNAANYGVNIVDFTASTIPLNAKQYWRVIGVHHLTGPENMSNHHVYCDVLDGDGRRVNQARLSLTQENTAPVFAVVDKPANEPGTNFPLWSKTRATVTVSYPTTDPLPSEAVTGIRTDHADEEIGNTWGHHSFYIVFQLTTIPEIGGEDTSGVDVPDDSSTEGTGEVPLSLEETIAMVGEPLIIPLNPDAMFYKIAKTKNLGERLTSEYDVTYLGKNYRAQTYERGIVYAEVGDWGNVKLIPRTN